MMNFTFKSIEGREALSSSMAFELFILDKAHFPTPWGHKDWQDLFNNQERFLIVILDEDTPIGFILYDLSSADSFAHLLKILVNPIFRGQSLGKRALRESIEYLSKKGFSHYFLEVEENNLMAQQLYICEGFRIIHRKKDFYGTGRAALIMTKDLE